MMPVIELQRLVADPLVTIGAHTITHLNLARVSEKRLRQELEDSSARVAG
jgi:peptidoglycan/xylan/chitin deacetylase (PgdA/CDA1 family)